ncbi:MAG: dihydroneopterin aldolase [Actinomycetota bacterium]
MADFIEIKGLWVEGRHGVLPEEHAQPQPFVIDLMVKFDARPAAASDDLADTVDYSALAESAVRVVQGEHCNLVETLAGRIAAVIMDHPRVLGVRVRVAKPDAPIDVQVDEVAVSVGRTRPGAHRRRWEEEA